MHHDIGHEFAEHTFDQGRIDDAAFDRREARVRRQVVAPPVAKLSIDETASPRASNKSATVEPTWPASRTKTFMNELPWL